MAMNTSEQSIRAVQNIKRLKPLIIAERRHSKFKQKAQIEAIIRLPLLKKVAKEDINDSEEVKIDKRNKTDKIEFQKARLMEYLRVLTPELTIKLKEALAQIICDKTVTKSDRHDAVKKLSLVDQTEVSRIIINEYILPENINMRSVFRKELKGIVEDNSEVKKFAIQKLKNKVTDSTDGSAQKLLDAIDPPGVVKVSRTNMQRLAGYSPMSSPTAFVLGGSALISNGVTGLRDPDIDDAAAGFTLGMGLLYISAFIQQCYQAMRVRS